MSKDPERRWKMEVPKPWALNKEASLGSSVKEFGIQGLRWRGQESVTRTWSKPREGFCFLLSPAVGFIPVALRRGSCEERAGLISFHIFLLWGSSLRNWQGGGWEDINNPCRYWAPRPGSAGPGVTINLKGQFATFRVTLEEKLNGD